METSFLSSNPFPRSTEIVHPATARLPAYTRGNTSFKNQTRKFGGRFSLTRCQSGQALPSPPPQGQERLSLMDSDWRAFRAKLVARERADGPSLSSIAYPDAAAAAVEHLVRPIPITIGDQWAHTIPEIEKGCLLIATDKLDGVHVFERTVILILSTGPIGPTGLILNRPSQISIKEMRSSPLDLSPVFSDRSLFPGGPMEDEMFLLTPDEKGIEKVEGSGMFEKVMEGLYYGARESIGCAAEMVKKGEIRVRDLRFFNGHCAWEGTLLREEIRAGYWTVAACSPSVIGLTSDGNVGLREDILGLVSP